MRFSYLKSLALIGAVLCYFAASTSAPTRATDVPNPLIVRRIADDAHAALRPIVELDLGIRFHVKESSALSMPSNTREAFPTDIGEGLTRQ